MIGVAAGMGGLGVVVEGAGVISCAGDYYYYYGCALGLTLNFSLRAASSFL